MPIAQGTTVVLTADLGERAEHWPAVARVRFGSARSTLGSFVMVPPPPGHREPSGPVGFAVDDDGSFWIADQARWRAAHYDPGGGYLGSVDGVPRRTGLRGLCLVGDRLVAIERQSMGVLWVAERDGATREVVPRLDGRRLFLSDLYAFEGSLFARVDGWAFEMGVTPPEQLGTGPHGVARVDLDTGTATRVPGVPIGGNTYVDVAPSVGGTRAAPTFRFVFRGPQRAWALTVRVRVVAEGHPVPAVVGPLIETSTRHRAGVVVAISASRYADQARFGGGTWLLGLSDDGSALIWERIPEGDGALDSRLHRDVAFGPDGTLYHLTAGPRAAVISRRPRP